MSTENGLSKKTELPKKLNTEEPEDLQSINLKDVSSFEIEKEKQVLKEQDKIVLSEVRASMGLEKIDEKDDDLTPEEREMAEYFLPRFKEEVILEKEKRDCRQEVVELQNLFNEFESKHPLDELYSIIDLTYKDAPNHPVREPARQYLIPILAKLNILKKETNVTTEEYDELNIRYKRISNAVGFINGDKVRH